MMGLRDPFRSRPYKSWHGYLILGVLALGLALTLYQKVAAWIAGPVVPTASVPEVTYEDVVQVPVAEPEPEAVSEPVVEPEPEPEPEGAPEVRTQYNLAVPWLSQAPYGVWDAMHEETCEEASFVMVVDYFDGVTGDIDLAQGDAELFDLVAYEEANGYDVSLTAAEAAAVIEGFYPKYDARVVENPTIADLKAFVDAGQPVIIPAAGRELGNPFFTGEGPVYHMLVLRGYTETTFITNDPGTRHGENYSYDATVFMEAIGDWEGHDPASGAKRVIVITPAVK